MPVRRTAAERTVERLTARPIRVGRTPLRDLDSRRKGPQRGGSPGIGLCVTRMNRVLSRSCLQGFSEQSQNSPWFQGLIAGLDPPDPSSIALPGQPRTCRSFGHYRAESERPQYRGGRSSCKCSYRSPHDSAKTGSDCTDEHLMHYQASRWLHAPKLLVDCSVTRARATALGGTDHLACLNQHA